MAPALIEFGAIFLLSRMVVEKDRYNNLTRFQRARSGLTREPVNKDTLFIRP